jgi:pilus assembly protein CpaF
MVIGGGGGKCDVQHINSPMYARRLNTGHRGTLATIHASSADESVRRLASLAIRSSANQQLSVAEEDVMRCIDLVVYVSRHQGRRRVENVLRVQRPA